MSAGSYIRFFVGIILSISVLASYFTKSGITSFSVLLAAVFIILSILWVLFRF